MAANHTVNLASMHNKEGNLLYQVKLAGEQCRRSGTVPCIERFLFGTNTKHFIFEAHMQPQGFAL